MMRWLLSLRRPPLQQELQASPWRRLNKLPEKRSSSTGPKPSSGRRQQRPLQPQSKQQLQQATKTLRSLPYATILQHKEAVLETLGPANDGVWRAASGVSVLELCDASARKAALALLGMVPGDHPARECANEIVSGKSTNG